MFSEDELLPLSALQHLSFCPRQWGLIHLEGIWSESVSTLEGRFLHEKSDEYGTEVRGDVRIVRGLRLRSLRLGISGMTDVVEFHRISAGGEGVRLQGACGFWKPFPVEYKHGSPKTGRWDEVQLCAQALCLEEMLGADVPEGALFYGKTRRRHDVVFDRSLREETEALARELHELSEKGVTPRAEYAPRCKRCSIMGECLPQATGKSAKKYVEKALSGFSIYLVFYIPYIFSLLCLYSGREGI